MHTEGMGVARDYRQAADWCRKSAQQGHANAQYFLGMMYDEGKGVAQDARQALDWYRKSAERCKTMVKLKSGWKRLPNKAMQTHNVSCRK